MKIVASRTLVLAMLVSLAAMFIAGGDACDVETLTWNMTCDLACKTPSLYKVCQELLQHAPNSADLTVYALVAARRATQTYDDTVDQMARLVAGGSLPGDERAAYLSCINRYATARVQMGNVIADMTDCQYARTRQEYVEAVAAVRTCGDGVPAGRPVAAKIAADLDVTTVAFDVGALVVGR